jgi:hypothetical protein
MPNPKLTEPVATFDDEQPTRPDWALDDDRMPVFVAVHRFDGEGEPLAEPERVEITMPRRPNPGLALEFLRMARTQGELAVSWLIEEAIGSDGYDTLVDELKRMPDPERGSTILEAIGERVQRVISGGLEGPKVSSIGRG